VHNRIQQTGTDSNHLKKTEPDQNSLIKKEPEVCDYKLFTGKLEFTEKIQIKNNRLI